MKHNSKILIYGGIAFFVIINILVYYHNEIISKFSKKFYKEYDKILFDSKQICKLYFDKLNMDKVSIGHDIFNLPENDYFLIYRYYKNSCNSCLENQIEYIKKYASIIGVSKIMFIPDSTNSKREFESFLIAHELAKYSFHFVSDTGFNLLQEPNENFFCIIDSANNVRMIFNPNNSIPLLNEMYFKIILEKYFSNESPLGSKLDS